MRLLAPNRDAVGQTLVLIMREASLKWGGSFAKVGWKLRQSGVEAVASTNRLRLAHCLPSLEGTTLKPTTVQIMNRLRLHY